jgi:hypothetical protein
MVLVSDLLAPIETLETHLGYLRARGHEIVIFQVLDPAELSLGFDEPAIFHDVESGRDLYVDPTTARVDYETRLRRHNDAVHAACDRLGIEYHRLITNQPLELALFDYLRGRLERGRVPSKRVRVL